MLCEGGRRKPSYEIHLICVMHLDYLDLCVTCAIVGEMPSVQGAGMEQMD